MCNDGGYFDAGVERPNFSVGGETWDSVNNVQFVSEEQLFLDLVSLIRRQVRVELTD